MTTTPDLAAARSGAGSGAEVARLHAAAEPDFARYEVLKDIVDECIDLSLELPSERTSGRLAVEGPPAALAAALGSDALGHPAALAAVRRSLRALRRSHRARSSTPPLPCSTRACGRGTSGAATRASPFPTTVATR